MKLDMKTLLTIEREVGDILAYNTAEARFNIPMPSLQFDAINGLLNRISDVINSVGELLNIKREMC